MSRSKQDTQIKIERFHFSVRLKSIFFPLELAELIPILEEVGYSVRSELSQRIPDVPFGVKVVAGGAIAEKRTIGQSFRLDQIVVWWRLQVKMLIASLKTSQTSKSL